MNISLCGRCNSELRSNNTCCLYSTSPGLIYEIGPLLLCDSCARSVVSDENLQGPAASIRLSMHSKIDESMMAMTDEGIIERCNELGLSADQALREARRLGGLCLQNTVDGELAAVKFWNSDRPEVPRYGKKSFAMANRPVTDRVWKIEYFMDELIREVDMSATGQVDVCRSILEIADPKTEGPVVGSTGTFLAEKLLNNRSSPRTEEQDFEEAIGLLKQSEQLAKQQSDPELVAECHNLLSFAYHRRHSGDERKNAGISIAFAQKALQVYSSESNPVEYAIAHNNLGSAYLDYSQDDDEFFEKALVSFHKALDAVDQRADPKQWAATNDHLASAYLERAAGDKEDNLDLAIAHAENSLRVYSRKDYLLDWAIAHSNLATVYGQRERGRDVDNVEHEVRHLELALQGFGEAGRIEDLAAIRNNLAIAYTRRKKGDFRANAKDTVRHAIAAMQFYTQASDSKKWSSLRDLVDVAEDCLAKAEVETQQSGGERSNDPDQAVDEAAHSDEAPQEDPSAQERIDRLLKDQSIVDEILIDIERGLEQEEPAESLIPLCFEALELLDRQYQQHDLVEKMPGGASAWGKAWVLVTNSLGSLLCELGYHSIARRQYVQCLQALTDLDPYYSDPVREQIARIDGRKASMPLSQIPFSWLGRTERESQHLALNSALMGDLASLSDIYNSDSERPAGSERRLLRKLTGKRWLATVILWLPWIVATVFTTGIRPLTNNVVLILGVGFAGLTVLAAKLHRSLILNLWTMEPFPERMKSPVTDLISRASMRVPLRRIWWIAMLFLAIVGYVNLGTFIALAIVLSTLLLWFVLKESVFPLFLDIQARDEALLVIAQRRIDTLPEQVQKMHETVQAIIFDHLENDTKFALYLRNFEAETRQHVIDESGPDRREVTSIDVALENKFFDSLTNRIPLIAVANPELRDSYLGEIPKLISAEEDWEHVLRDLIGSAHAIIFAVSKVSLGLSIEAEMILACGRIDRTIVVTHDDVSRRLVSSLFYDKHRFDQEGPYVNVVRAGSIDFENLHEHEPFKSMLAN